MTTLATTPPPAEPPAVPKPLFGVHPRYVRIEGSPGPVLAIVITPEHADAKRLSGDGSPACRELLTRVREQFFATGPGRQLRDQEARLATVEKESAASEVELARIRDEWRNAVAMDSASDVGRLEKMIATQQANANRLAVRVPIVREEVERLRRVAANELYAVLANVKDDFEERAEAELHAARAALAEVVNATFAAWLGATSELAGCRKVEGHALRLLASSGERVPARIERATPGTLPELVCHERTAEERAQLEVKIRKAVGPGYPIKVIHEPERSAFEVPGELVQTDFGPMLRLGNGTLVDVKDSDSRRTPASAPDDLDD